MFIGECPHRGQTLISYSRLQALVNYEPGVIVVCWSCPCGAQHLTATGSIGSTDPTRASAAIDSLGPRIAARDGHG